MALFSPTNPKKRSAGGRVQKNISAQEKSPSFWKTKPSKEIKAAKNHLKKTNESAKNQQKMPLLYKPEGFLTCRPWKNIHKLTYIYIPSQKESTLPTSCNHHFLRAMFNFPGNVRNRIFVCLFSSTPFFGAFSKLQGFFQLPTIYCRIEGFHDLFHLMLFLAPIPWTSVGMALFTYINGWYL